MSFSRRTMISGAGALAVAGCANAVAPDVSTPPIAASANGRLRGAWERGVQVYRGVPYAGAVSTPEMRFRAPPPAPSWTGVRDAVQLGPQAVQPGNPGSEASSEDCLFLNVWTPAADGRRRPVMFYCHGGGFTTGSGGRGYQDGANLAREQDVVVVASNHRLGVFGYLYLGGLLGERYEANQGLLDLVAALRWVNENIEAFGGDPNNVMVFGESGGGGKATCLYGMPAAAPYFNKASIESPIGPDDFSPEAATEVAREAMRWFDVSDPRRLLEIPTAQWLQFQTGEGAPPSARESGNPPRRRDLRFWPLIDGRVLPELPFKQSAPAISARKPLMVGTCRDEAVFFHFGDPGAFALDAEGLRTRLQATYGARAEAWINAFRASRPEASPSQLLMAIETASPWRAHAVEIAERKAAEATAPVYSYILNYNSPTPVPGTDFAMGCPHAADIVMKFNNAVANGAAGSDFFNADQSEERLRTARNMSGLWASFARSGRPALAGQPAWAPYSMERRETLLIDASCQLVSDPEAQERRFWQGESGAGEVRP